MPNIYDLTSTQIQQIIDLLNAGAVTTDDLSAAIGQARNSNSQPFPAQNVTISGGAITASRFERLTWVEVDNGGIAGQTLATISGSSPDTFEPYDILFLTLPAGQLGLFVDSTGNIATDGTLYMPDSDAVLMLAYVNASWKVLAQSGVYNPRNGRLDRVSATIDNATGVITLLLPSNIIEAVSEKTAETLATATVTFLLAGVAGRYTAFVDMGFGAIEIGAYDYAAFEPVNNLATNLAANINAGSGIHGFTALAVGAAVTITAPTGTGAGANLYVLSESNTGGATTALIPWGGGVDGAFQDEGLSNIVGLQANTLCMVKNAMPANTVTIMTGFSFTNPVPLTLNPGDYAVVVADAVGAIDVVSVSSTGLRSFVQTAGAYAMTTANYYLECTAGTFTVTLPTAFGFTSKEYVIKNSGVGTITVDPDGVETIDGALTVDLFPGDSITIVSNGSNWIII